MKNAHLEEKHNYLTQQLDSFLSLIGVTSATKVTVMSYEMTNLNAWINISKYMKTGLRDMR